MKFFNLQKLHKKRTRKLLKNYRWSTKQITNPFNAIDISIKKFNWGNHKVVFFDIVLKIKKLDK